MTPAANDFGAPDAPAAFPFLEAWLAPLLPLLARPDVTDLYINRPGEAWVETLGGVVERHELAGLDEAQLWRLARQIASIAHQGISREHPLLAARLPDGSRVQIVAPPATRGPMAIAIRRHIVSDLSLADYAAAGAFAEAETDARSRPPAPPPRPAQLSAWLADAVRARRTILISGGTSSGKTTFLNALLREIPAEERLILIEDTPELIVRQPNMVGLVASKGELGEARVTPEDLLQASLRMRPDRIILGELRGSEAYSFLRAINTGHPGSMSTIHANDPDGAVEQLALIVQAGSRLARRDVIGYVRQAIDIFVHLERRGGRRRVARVIEARSLYRSGTEAPE